MKLVAINNKVHTIKNRVIWTFNPSSRTVKSKKIYNRKKGKLNLNRHIKSI